MSDSEGNAAPNPPSSLPPQSQAPPSHAPTGGKSLPSAMPTTTTTRAPYKSYRKKYRKMHSKFSLVLEENKRLFKDEQKLSSIASRLREELDGLLELCLDLNQNPALPPSLRFDIGIPAQNTAVAAIPSVVSEDIAPQAANDMFVEYTSAVQRGQIPHLDLHVIREQLEGKLRVQGVQSLDELEARISHTRPDLSEGAQLPDEVLGAEPPGLLGSEQEDAYLLRLDAKLGDPASLRKEVVGEERHWADMTAREVERQVELLNPQSQHNWLKTHAKGPGGDVDDNESLADAKPAPTRKRNLAKQVGDRAVGRAREGVSPGAASQAGNGEEDGEGYMEEPKKRARGGADADGTYRVKGGKRNDANGGGGGKGKRKRANGEEGTVGGGSATKKTKVEG